MRTGEIQTKFSSSESSVPDSVALMISLVGDGALACRPRRLLAVFFFMADIPSIKQYQQTQKDVMQKVLIS
jgi:hypothetical protein